LRIPLRIAAPGDATFRARKITHFGRVRWAGGEARLVFGSTPSERGGLGITSSLSDALFWIAVDAA
jgi:hypothetical protein